MVVNQKNDSRFSKQSQTFCFTELFTVVVRSVKGTMQPESEI